MANDFTTFQKFQDPELAQDILNLLRQNHLECEIEDHNKFFDASFANNRIEASIILKIRKDDFEKADKILNDYYSTHLDTVESDYYLFEFTDEELYEIIARPDEWGKYDYLLAQKILKERG